MSDSFLYAAGPLCEIILLALGALEQNPHLPHVIFWEEPQLHDAQCLLLKDIKPVGFSLGPWTHAEKPFLA